jgi:ABC-2 type transport system ATP-binding protein
MALIEVRNLFKTFSVTRRRPGLLGTLHNLVAPPRRLVTAVDGVSFDLQEGELVGYLGPNGAGKSTTIKMLTGLLVPTSGEVRVDGFVPWRDRPRYVARIGAVFGQRTTLWWDLPVIESFELLQPMYRVPPDRFRRSLDDLCRTARDGRISQHAGALALAGAAHARRPVRGAAARAAPGLLDEPTIGLDVVAKERIRQFIQHINRERGVTVLLTTHDLSDVERLCERVMILDHGQVLYDGTLATLNQRFESDWSLVVTFAEPMQDVNLPGLVPRSAKTCAQCIPLSITARWPQPT